MVSNPSSNLSSFDNIEGKVNDQNKAPLVDLSDNAMQMNDGLKFDLMPSSSFGVTTLPMAPKPLEATLLDNAQPKFRCKYCVKKFASKQALGGHQNAHKLLRFIENNNKNGMLEMGCANTEHPRSPGRPLARPYLLTRAIVNCPYFIPFIPKALHGYHPRGSGASEPSCHRSLAIEQRSRPMMTNSCIAPPIIMGNWVVNGSYFSTNSIPTVPVKLSFTTVPQLLFTNTLQAGDNARSKRGSDSEKLQIEAQELDLTLKLGH